MSINNSDELGIIFEYTLLKIKYDRAITGGGDSRYFGASFYKKLLDQAVAKHSSLLGNDEVLPFVRTIATKIHHTSIADAEVEILKKRIAELEKAALEQDVERVSITANLFSVLLCATDGIFGHAQIVEDRA